MTFNPEVDCIFCDNSLEDIKKILDEEAHTINGNIALGKNICTDHLLVRVDIRKGRGGLMGTNLLIAIKQVLPKSSS